MAQYLPLSLYGSCEIPAKSVNLVFLIDNSMRILQIGEEFCKNNKNTKGLCIQ